MSAVKSIADAYKSKVNQATSNAHDLKELLPFLQCIPPEKIKKFIKENVNAWDESSIKKMYLKSFSIVDTIPEDIIQHILSFQQLQGSYRCVNKKWNELSQKNERQYYLKLVISINESSPIPYNTETNTTWVHSELSNVEKDLGFKRMYKMKFAMGECKNGDRVLVKNRLQLECRNCHWDEEGLWNKSISIIGVGNKAGFSGGNSQCCQILHNEKSKNSEDIHVYIENMTFDYAECKHAEGVLKVNDRAKLSLNKCKFHSCRNWTSPAINVTNGGSLAVKNCEFIGGSTGVHAYTTAKEVMISNSLFKSFRKCIAIYGEYISDTMTLQLRCDGNMFQDSLDHPIVETSNDQKRWSPNESWYR